MNCQHCGHELTNNEDVCPNCGGFIEKQTNQETGEKKKLGKKPFFIGGAILAVIIILSVFYTTGKAKFDPNKQIQAFKEAVLDEKTKDVAAMLLSSENSLEITEDNTKKLVDYLKNNNDDFNQLIERLEDQASDYEKGRKSYTDGVYGTINLEKGGKKWLFFDEYHFVVVPAHIHISSANSEIDILINDEKVDTTSEHGTHNKKYGPYMPGEYTVKGKLESEYFDAEEKEDIVLFDLNEDVARAEIEMNIGRVHVSSPFSGEATLFINDKKTDITVERGRKLIGQFPLDEPITFHVEKEMPWDTIQSDKKALNEEGPEINFDNLRLIIETEEEEIVSLVNDVFNSYTEALNKKDISVLHKQTTDNFKELFDEDLKRVKKEVPKYKGTLLSAHYRNDFYQEPKYDEKQDAYVFEVNMMFTYYEPNGSLGKLFDGDNNHEYQRGRTVTMIYDEKDNEWKVDSWKKAHMFTFDDTPYYEINKKPKSKKNKKK
ncbi:MAG TPA: hypothetical protein VIG73_06080 [Cerasibacillus sp.]|uniref:zinc ribbon domain-containing protein n=1 Tax=Cerasibacillus sp. TaxID=2498711 RepID=UPI002F3ED6B1